MLLPLLPALALQTDDWLIDPDPYVATMTLDDDASMGGTVRLGNGLVRRTWRVEDGVGLVALDELASGRSLLRSTRPMARVTVDGVEHAVGGMTGQGNHAFLREEDFGVLEPFESALRVTSIQSGEIEPRLEWARVRHAAPDAVWPPEGQQVTFTFEYRENVASFDVRVHVTCYDGLPAFSKWIEVENTGTEPIGVDRITTEELALVETRSYVETREGVALTRPDHLHVETDFAFGGMVAENANRHVVHYRPDPLYATQVNYLRQTPCLLQVEPTYGPAQRLAPGETFESYRTFELVHDSDDQERRSLALRRMYRTISPWTTENPLMHHLRVSDLTSVVRAIDDAAEVGFEMVILSFGSGFDIETEDPQVIAMWKGVADYADSKGVEIGGYSLLSSRRIGDGNDIVSPEGQSPTHGNCPALTSEWGQRYFEKLYAFFEATGFDLLEHDGPYPGDVDVTPRPPLQQGEQDSRWVQWRIATDFYRWCRSRGIYLNTPDFYYHAGSNKCGMGYRETNWSLPRADQVIHTRQNIFDGTWSKAPSMGWMFVPLSEYHGGGAAATIEPLDEHSDHYARMLDANLALGVQACYRGPRLFDTDRVRDLVAGRVAWFKQHRAILESDLIHGRRADGRDVDWMLHVNPRLDECGMLVAFNPLDEEVTRMLDVDLYYTGLTDRALATTSDGRELELTLDRRFRARIPVTVPAGGMTWVSLRSGDER